MAREVMDLDTLALYMIKLVRTSRKHRRGKNVSTMANNFRATLKVRDKVLLQEMKKQRKKGGKA